MEFIPSRRGINRVEQCPKISGRWFYAVANLKNFVRTDTLGRRVQLTKAHLRYRSMADWDILFVISYLTCPHSSGDLNGE